MDNIQEEILVDMMKKLGMKKDDQLIRKSKEIRDIIAIKSSGMEATVNDSAKTIICLDISCELLNIAFDTALGIRLSSIRKSAYNKYRQLMMKLMKFNKTPNISDVVLKMRIQDENVQKTARKIFETFQKNSPHIDLDHPQYVQMSVYQACKIHKYKASKKDFRNGSNLNVTQWSQLETAWDKWVHCIESKEKVIKQTAENIALKSTEDHQPTLKRNHEIEEEAENYDVWAKRILDKAYEEMKKEKPKPSN
ncbi:CLUMA_CG016263, isoform A [Clunio marinus]|uniref:CLUMA_CG016263, isoform A n=1 Tax=Clunio marinus TaxID=568069 RepID=A0A1J1IT23_9DIPT|nr:CLUMA_CG016263, isoform A [Clunio marinus]